MPEIIKIVLFENMRQHLLCIHKRISRVYTRDLLCMHDTLAGARDPKKERSRAWDRPSALFGSLAQEISCVDTRDLLCMHKRIPLCMHKLVVHAQEISCVYTRDSFVYTQEILSRWGTFFLLGHVWTFYIYLCVFMTT